MLIDMEFRIDIGDIRIYKAIILSVVLYGCETWSLTLREGVGEQGAEENICTKEG
jgi:hypothetical protein